MDGFEKLLQCAYVKYDDDLNVIITNEEFDKEFGKINNIKDRFISQDINKFKIINKDDYIIIGNSIYTIKVIHKDNYYYCTLSKDTILNEFSHQYHRIGFNKTFTFVIHNNYVLVNESCKYKFSDEFLKNVIHQSDLIFVNAIRNHTYVKPYVDIRIKKNNVLSEKENYSNYDWYRVHFQKVDTVIMGVAFNINSCKELEHKYINMNDILKNIHSNNLLSYRINLSSDECVLTKNQTQSIFFQSVTRSSLLLNAIYDRITIGDDINKIIFENLKKEFYLGNTNHKIVCKMMISKDNNIWVEIKINLYRNPQTEELEGTITIDDVNSEVEYKHTLNNVVDSNYDFLGSVDMNCEYITFFDRDFLSHNLILRRGKYNQMAKEYLDVYVEKDKREEYFKEIKYENVIEKLKNKDTYIFTMAVKFKGQIYYKRWTFFKNRESNELVMYSTDVTKIVSEELRQKQELREAVRIANDATKAKREFLSQISHDIRTPMNGILGLINLSLKENIPHDVKENLEIAYNSGEYLLELINDTLDMNMIEENKMTFKTDTFALYDVIKNIFSTFFIEIQNKNLHINTFIGDIKGIIVNADKSRFSQLLVNIISNAIKYTSQNGTINFKIDGFEKNGYYNTTVIVEDTGIGMSEDFLPNIFNTYARENRNNVKGTGIGMFIVKGIIDRMKGTIDIQSKVDVGTKVTVNVSLPINKDATLPLSEDNYNFKGVNVLLVDDDYINIKVGKMFLENKGFIVYTATNGQEALKVLIEKPPIFDLVLMDIRMPIMNGYDTTKKIRTMPDKYLLELPVIAMSANAFEEDINLSIQCGMNDHISKPIKPQILYETIARNLKKRKTIINS